MGIHCDRCGQQRQVTCGLAPINRWLCPHPLKGFGVFAFGKTTPQSPQNKERGDKE